MLALIPFAVASSLFCFFVVDDMASAGLHRLARRTPFER